MPVVESAVKLHSVLLATDFSQASAKPLHHALAIAHCYGAKFYLAHVVSSLGLTIAGPDAIALSEQAVRRDSAHLAHDLVRTGMLSGLKHQFLIRVGDVWPELELIIQEEKIDLVVIGTHGRHGIGKLLLRSVAEQIFRQADCMALTVRPGSYQESPVGKADPNRTFLFATDLGDASLQTLPQAVSLSNQFGAKLVLFNVSPSVPIPDRVHLHQPKDWMQLRENSAVMRVRLEELPGI